MKHTLQFSLVLIGTCLSAHDYESAVISTQVTPVGSKRRFSELHCQRIGKGTESFGKVHYEKKLGANGAIWAYYTCARCNVKPMSAKAILKHLHNECFPAEGLPCNDCRVENPESTHVKFSNFTQMLNHNVEFHFALKYWRCFACDTNVKKHDFFKHVNKNTANGSRNRMMGDFHTESDFKNFMRELAQKKQTKIDSSEQPDIAWKFYAVIGEKNNRKMVPLSDIVNISDE